MKQRIIGFAGPQEAGKSTAAAYLRTEHGFRGSNLTDPFDEMLSPLLVRMGVPAHEIMPRLTGPMKNTPIPGFEWLTGRKLKQALGLEFRDAVSRPAEGGGTDSAFFQDLWYADNADEPNLVHEQIRYAFEAEGVRRRGGIVVMIVDPDAERRDDHASELLDFEGDETIENRKTGTGPLHARLDEIVAATAPPQVAPGEGPEPIAELEDGINRAIDQHGPAVRAYADRLDDGDDDLSETVDDVISEIKTRIAADAANRVADGDAEAAISSTERRITDDVSNSTSDRRIAAVFAELGPDEAERILGGGDG